MGLWFEMVSLALAGATALVVSLSGVSGVHEWSSVHEAAARWHMPIRFVHSDNGGSGAYGDAPLCERGVRGVAYFAGPDAGPLNFRSAWFASGARTDRGVTTGTTEAALHRAYGAALHREPALGYDGDLSDIDWNFSGKRGQRHAVYTVTRAQGSAENPRTEITFGLSNGHVVLIGWSLRTNSGLGFIGLQC
jgi:hypothetical protein